MISEEEAIVLLRKHGINEGIIEHSVGVADVAYRIALKHDDVDAHAMKIAGLLHDIGKSRGCDDHVEQSMHILEEEGLGELKSLVYHGVDYEMSIINGHEDTSFLPQNKSEMIMQYADMRFANVPMTLHERFEDLYVRYAHKKKLVKALKMALPRFERMEKELNVDF